MLKVKGRIYPGKHGTSISVTMHGINTTVTFSASPKELLLICEELYETYQKHQEAEKARKLEWDKKLGKK